MLTSPASGGSYTRLNAGPSSRNDNSILPSGGPAPTAANGLGGSSRQPSGIMPTAGSSPFPIAPAPSPQQMMQPTTLAPYQPHAQTAPMHMAPQAPQQSQIICTGCRTLLVYPHNATNVRCALCSTVTPVPPAGTEMAQLVCGGCRTLLMYIRGASSVQCSCCHTVNIAMETNQIAHINCGGCGMTLMYSYGAQSVKCAVCQFVSSVAIGGARLPLSVQRPPYQAPPQSMPTQQVPILPTAPPSQAQQTVVVENPMTMDDSGHLVSNVAVGVTTAEKKP